MSSRIPVIIPRHTKNMVKNKLLKITALSTLKKMILSIMQTVSCKTYARLYCIISINIIIDIVKVKHEHYHCNIIFLVINILLNRCSY